MATKRLIDANALLEKVQFRMAIDNKNAEIIAGCVDITRRLIDNAPTVDAVEVVHGEWTVIEDDYDDCTILECSVCEVSFRFDEYDGLLPQAQTYHYCPNCGAKMDGYGYEID